MKNTTNKTRSTQFYTFIARVFSELKQFKVKGNKTDFNTLMEKILPGVKLYISTELGRALKNESIPSGKYEAADFVDELYILAYDHLDEVEEDQHFYSWLFKKADELLEDAIIEEDFDHTFYENIDHFRKFEWEAMEENFSTDADGDLVMEEELDDLSYPKNNYTLDNVFVEDQEQELIEKIDKELTD